MPIDLPITDEERTFQFYGAGWNPMHHTREHAKKLILQGLESALDGYLDHIEALAEARGLVRTKEKQSRHFDWLALFQVDKRPYAQIARDAGLEVATIESGVKDAARMIALPLRTGGRPGRPRKETQP